VKARDSNFADLLCLQVLSNLFNQIHVLIWKTPFFDIVLYMCTCGSLKLTMLA
jgi:hypothetical protein